jgi:hypothetical protein
MAQDVGLLSPPPPTNPRSNEMDFVGKLFVRLIIIIFVALELLILNSSCGPTTIPPPTPTIPWVGADSTTYHVYHFIKVEQTPGDPYSGIWHGKLFGADEPFLWAFAGDFQYSLNFQTMTGADIPSPPCKLVFWRSYGRP